MNNNNDKQIAVVLDLDTIAKAMKVATRRSKKEWGVKTSDMLRDAVNYYISSNTNGVSGEEFIKTIEKEGK